MFVHLRSRRGRRLLGTAATGGRGSGRPLAALSAGLLASGLLLGGVAPAHAEDGVPYLDDLGQPQTVDTATPLSGGGATTLSTGWYLCTTAVTYSGTVTVSGEVNLILGDGCDMKVDSGGAGIDVSGTNSLAIYGQSTDSAAAGKLTAWGEQAGIGGGAGASGGSVTINGGTVSASGVAAAGIGGGDGGDGGVVTINGGTVTATGSEENDGAGIGGSGADGGVITINGGTVTAEAYYGAGIGGGGWAGDGGSITITGGTVNASNIGGWGAGIGGGLASSGGTIVISGGTVTAQGGAASAGIGGGSGTPVVGGTDTPFVGGDSGAITITGHANVTADGGPAVAVAGTPLGGGPGIGAGGGDSQVAAVDSIIVSPTAAVTAVGGPPTPDGTDPDSAAVGGPPIGRGGLASSQMLLFLFNWDAGNVTPGTVVTTHAITVAPVVGGTVTPVGPDDADGTTVPDGANQTFRVVPDPGAHLVSVSADHATVQGHGDTWTVSDVTADTTLTAVFDSPITAATLTVAAPATGLNTASTASTSDQGYTVSSVSWDSEGAPAEPNTAYTATITLTAAPGHSFSDATTATVNGESATVTPSGDGTSATVVYRFPATAATAAPTLRLAPGPAAGVVTATLSGAYPSAADTPVTFTWTDETTQATGTVCPAALTDATGAATCDLSHLPPGTYTISASTLGDATNAAASDSITGYVVPAAAGPGTSGDPGTGDGTGTGTDTGTGTGTTGGDTGTTGGSGTGTAGGSGAGTGQSGTGDDPAPRPPWHGMAGADRDHDGLPDAIDPNPAETTPWRTADNGDLIIGVGEVVKFSDYRQPHGHRVGRSARGKKGTYVLTFRIHADGKVVPSGAARLVDTHGDVLARSGRPGRHGTITFRYNPSRHAALGRLRVRIVYLGVTGTYAGRGSAKSWPIVIAR